eukprot:GEMP01063914.1.p1 GENE.GEMP01063914.1~~GEMP01063914.1.p1  ORF type:complete len:200 (-),score=52.69 GEMP01063914.1:390-989(-)
MLKRIFDHPNGDHDTAAMDHAPAPRTFATWNAMDASVHGAYCTRHGRHSAFLANVEQTHALARQANVRAGKVKAEAQQVDRVANEAEENASETETLMYAVMGATVLTMATTLFVGLFSLQTYYKWRDSRRQVARLRQRSSLLEESDTPPEPKEPENPELHHDPGDTADVGDFVDAHDADHDPGDIAEANITKKEDLKSQ